MKSYRDFEKDYIGTSDYAALILVGLSEEDGLQTKVLNFGEDNDYHAYIVEGKAEIGAHYTLVAEFDHWLKIYDDDSLVKEYDASMIKVYRAGQMGCIIQLLQ